MAVKIDAVQARAQALLNVAQREKDKRARAKKEVADDTGDDEATADDLAQPIRPIGGLVDRCA